jgi:TetR/AcrR family transcriptional repressor of nem operon
LFFAPKALLLIAIIIVLIATAIIGVKLVKVSREKVEQNRQKLVDTAGRLFREHGINGVGVAEISKAAGLTHGALYAQFPSKDALAADAFWAACEESFGHFLAATQKRPTLSTCLAFLISEWQRDHMAAGCPMTASASEIGRADPGLSRRFADAFERIAKTIEGVLDPSLSLNERRARSLAIVAAEIGAIVVSRAVQKATPDLSDQVLKASRRTLGLLAK